MEALSAPFHLEVNCQGDKIRVGTLEGGADEITTLKFYEISELTLTRMETCSARIKDLLRKSNKNGRAGSDVFESIKRAGQVLYDNLLPLQAKEKLNATLCKTLILSIDDKLVSVPWELMFDGKEFLCQRFSMGRVVSTRQKFFAQKRELKTPLSILIVSDPQGNLKNSYLEGVEIRDMIDEMDCAANTTLKSTNVSKEFLKGQLRAFDILHYAGHADYVPENPEASGFILKDGKLEAREFRNLVGRMPFPAFVFSNACQSGETAPWNADSEYENIFGLANAFLLSGVRHYLGTFWEVQDEPSLCFAKAFYKSLLAGNAIGECLRKARQTLIATYGIETLVWASYMLYGDPTTRYVSISPDENSSKVKDTGKWREQLQTSRNSHLQTRGKLSPLSIKSNRWLLPLVVISIIFVFAQLAGMNHKISFNSRRGSGSKSVEISGWDEKKPERINQLIQELGRKVKERSNSAPPTDEFSGKGQPSIVFLNTQVFGMSRVEKKFILSKINQVLLDSGSVQIVEREILESLLRELRLSASDLSDNSTALKIGKILSAQLIGTGSIIRSKNEWSINLRVVETETTSVKIALTDIYNEPDMKVVAKKIGEKIIRRIKVVYPKPAR